MIRTHLIRDKKEITLAIYESRIKGAEERKLREEAYFKKCLAEYQEWKKANNIEGLKY